MNDDKTFIKIFRKIFEWEWYSDVNVCRVFIHLLLKANHKPNRWKGQVIERGSLVTSYAKLGKQTTLSIQSVRTCLNKLKSTNELTIKTTNKFTIISLTNYDNYQSYKKENNTIDNTENNKQLTNNQQTINKQLTTNNNVKNEKNVNNKSLFETKQNNFYNQIAEYKDKYPKEMLRAFYDYWSEPNSCKSKMKFELEKTFEIKRRLEYWSRNDKQFNKSNGTAKIEVTKERIEELKKKYI